MKTLIWVISWIILVILASFMATSEESGSFVLKTFAVGDEENIETGYDNLNTFVIGQETTAISRLNDARKRIEGIRERNNNWIRMEEEINRCIEKRTRNWKREYSKKSYDEVYDKDRGEWVIENVFWEKEYSIFGYDKKEDFKLRWRLRNRALNGENVC